MNIVGRYNDSSGLELIGSMTVDISDVQDYVIEDRFMKWICNLAYRGSYYICSRIPNLNPVCRFSLEDRIYNVPTTRVIYHLDDVINLLIEDTWYKDNWEFVDIYLYDDRIMISIGSYNDVYEKDTIVGYEHSPYRLIYLMFPQSQRR